MEDEFKSQNVAFPERAGICGDSLAVEDGAASRSASCCLFSFWRRKGEEAADLCVIFVFDVCDNLNELMWTIPSPLLGYVAMELVGVCACVSVALCLGVRVVVVSVSSVSLLFSSSFFGGPFPVVVTHR